VSSGFPVQMGCLCDAEKLKLSLQRGHLSAAVGSPAVIFLNVFLILVLK
jgi:hypothetical protein